MTKKIMNTYQIEVDEFMDEEDLELVKDFNE